MTGQRWSEGWYESADGLSLFYRDYASGSSDAGVPVLCLHGLTRNSRDFSRLADRICRVRRVLAPDLRGRGRSDRDPDWRNYNPVQYADDVSRLLDELGIGEVVVIGTSLGGWLAMLLAGRAKDRIAAAVLNDIGPEVAVTGLERIKAAAGSLGRADSLAGAVDETRRAYETALPGLGEEDWRWYAATTYRRLDDGTYDLDYDRDIGHAARAGASGLPEDPWQLFRALGTVPTLLLHGELSDVLTPAIIDRMVEAKPDLEVRHIPDRGHAPLLDEKESLDAITTFLAEH